MSMLNHRFEDDYEIDQSETPELDFSESENFDQERESRLDDALIVFLEFN